MVPVLVLGDQLLGQYLLTLMMLIAHQIRRVGVMPVDEPVQG